MFVRCHLPWILSCEEKPISHQAVLQGSTRTRERAPDCDVLVRRAHWRITSRWSSRPLAGRTPGLGAHGSKCFQGSSAYHFCQSKSHATGGRSRGRSGYVNANISNACCVRQEVLPVSNSWFQNPVHLPLQQFTCAGSPHGIVASNASRLISPASW